MILILFLCLELVVWFCWTWYEILVEPMPKMSYSWPNSICPRSTEISPSWKCYFPVGCHWIVVLELVKLPLSGSRGHVCHWVVVGIISWDNLWFSVPFLLESWFRLRGDHFKVSFFLHVVYGWVERGIVNSGYVFEKYKCLSHVYLIYLDMIWFIYGFTWIFLWKVWYICGRNFSWNSIYLCK